MALQDLAESRRFALAASEFYVMDPRKIDINDYDYDLPEDRIAMRPVARRDQSRLLIYSEGRPQADIFRNLPARLPEGAVLLFNDTKVVQARLLFQRPTGARIELFCLEPVLPAEHQTNLSSPGPVVWSCLIGNAKRWKEETLAQTVEWDGRSVNLRARRLKRRGGAFDVAFSWDDPQLSFATILDAAGHIPLPPYIKRADEALDKQRYQTVYAKYDGSVAAPTAGLHFTPGILEALDRQGVERLSVTLHVGAGTFLPVKSDLLDGHDMHSEQVQVGVNTLQRLQAAVQEGRPIIPVGTTSMRVLESLHWHGLALAEGRGDPVRLAVGQWAPYEINARIEPAAALDYIIQSLQDRKLSTLTGQTRLLIAPGYRFALSRGLVTNFHQPRSTLLLLIAALIGEDWRKVYRFALDKDFRFLSYGDSSLLLP